MGSVPIRRVDRFIRQGGALGERLCEQEVDFAPVSPRGRIRGCPQGWQLAPEPTGQGCREESWEGGWAHPTGSPLPGVGGGKGRGGGCTSEILSSASRKPGSEKLLMIIYCRPLSSRSPFPQAGGCPRLPAAQPSAGARDLTPTPGVGWDGGAGVQARPSGVLLHLCANPVGFSDGGRRVGHRRKNTAWRQAPCGQEHASLQLAVPVASLALPPLAEPPLQLQLVGEEHLPPAHVLGQGPHVRGDGVAGRQHDLLPQFVTRAQLRGDRETRVRARPSTPEPLPVPAAPEKPGASCPLPCLVGERQVSRA